MAKILLVEDDKSLREIYGVRLMAEGFEIVSAGDGEEALAMAIKERPNLIISDVMMPKISGFDMLDILRSTTETKDVKVIMMTALSSDDQRARGEALGADRYLVKSQVGIEDVVRTVHDVLGDAPVSASANAAPAFTAPAPTPAPEPAPVAAPVATNVPATPVAPLVSPAPTFAPAFAAPAATPQQPSPLTQAPVTPAPTPTPAPVASEPVTPAPVAPAPLSPEALAPQPQFAQAQAQPPLPQPTAPFSSPAPASLGERVIEPLTAPANPVSSTAPVVPAAPLTPTDIASQMQQALNGPTPTDPNGPATQ